MLSIEVHLGLMEELSGIVDVVVEKKKTYYLAILQEVSLKVAGA
jgi:hypothetical protein